MQGSVDEVEARLTAAFGRQTIERVLVGTATTFRRAALGDEPLVLVIVNGRGDVSVLLDNFVHDDDWRAAVDTLQSPGVVDVHHGEAGIHCFVLNGPGGAVLFTADDEQDAISATETEAWLRGLDCWAGAWD